MKTDKEFIKKLNETYTTKDKRNKAIDNLILFCFVVVFLALMFGSLLISL